MTTRIPHRGLRATEHQEREQARSYLSHYPVSTSDVFLEIFFEEEAIVYSGNEVLKLAHEFFRVPKQVSELPLVLAL